MPRKRSHLVVSAVAWTAFVLVVAWTAAFLAGGPVPVTVDGPARTGTAPAIAVDLGLLLLFAAQHTIMARRPAKAWLRRRVPPPLERTCYVLAADACLILLLVAWQPWGGDVWRFGGAAAGVLWAGYGAGWLLAVAATFAVDHLDLTGLRQAGWADAAVESGSVLRIGGLHRAVRHPLMAGLLVAFWSTPHMGASHLLFAAAMTGYVAVGIGFEERDLRRRFGAAYDDYASRVPALVPGTSWTRRRFRA